LTVLERCLSRAFRDVAVVDVDVAVAVAVADEDRSARGHGYGHDLLRLSRDYGYPY
jgi:hypothetical protein